MSRQSNHKLLLDGVEYDWLVRTIDRKARVVDQEPNKRLRAAFRGLQNKVEELASAPPLPGEPSVLATNRIEARLLQELIVNTVEALTTTIIPNMQADGEEKHKARLEAAGEQVQLLNGLRTKIERTLK